MLVVKLTYSLNDSIPPVDSSYTDSVKTTQTIGKWIIYDDTITNQAIEKPEILTSDTTAPTKNISTKLKRRKKIFSTICAFPVPFGFFGLHRIYLGTKPYVPLVYIATFGGAAGIVPFIDFMVLLLERDVSKYENNPNVIMWAN